MVSNGVVPVLTGRESAAYESAPLHVRVSPTGRYALPERRYVYGASWGTAVYTRVSGNTGELADWVTTERVRGTD